MSKKTQSQAENERLSPIVPVSTPSQASESTSSAMKTDASSVEHATPDAPAAETRSAANAPAALQTGSSTTCAQAEDSRTFSAKSKASGSEKSDKSAGPAAAESSASPKTSAPLSRNDALHEATSSSTNADARAEDTSPDAASSASPATDVSPTNAPAAHASPLQSDANPAESADISAADAQAPASAAAAPTGDDAGKTSQAPEDEEDLSQYETSAKEAGLEACGSDIDSDDFVHPADRAEHLEQLPLNKQLCVLTHLSTEEAAEALAELDEEVAGDVLENMDADDAARLIAEMDPDDAVDILDEVEEGHRDILLSNLPADDAEELRMLLSFDPDTAAGVMNTDIIMVSSSSTVDEAIMLIRSELEEKEMPYYVYVVDSQETLEGVISLRDLMLARPGTLLTNMVNKQDVISVQYDTDKAEVARLLGHYNFLCLPVVDREEHLMGVVTHDDVLDIIQDEASSDMLGMVGAGQDENVDTPWTRSVRIRLPWLVINMCTSSLSAFIVSLFEGSIAQMALLAVLMPMVANQAGNTGQQALAVMIRQLATESFDARRSWGAVFRESKIGLGTGIFMALLAYVGVMFLSHNSMLATVMGIALLLDMLLGAIAGGAIPLILRALGRDPAQASSIFLTALTDSGGFFIFLGLATTFLL